jgi:hypothetical protein
MRKAMGLSQRVFARLVGVLGVDSAPRSTDVGVDLVAYSPRRSEPLCFQIKTNTFPV